MVNRSETPFALAVIVAVCPAWIEEAVTLNVAEVVPPGTVTPAGTETFALLAERATGNPSPGAPPVRATVHVADAGALTLAGAQLSALSARMPG
jgi:hypothetical protein